MTGLALEGGAKCTAFTAGVLDVFMERGISFPIASGVSAGAGCLANYRSNQPGRSLGTMLPSEKGKTMGLKNFLKKRQFIDFDTLASAEWFDLAAYLSSEMKTDFVVTCCETGKPEYITGGDSSREIRQSLQASCSVPIMCKPVAIGARHYLDGSVSDAVPVLHLFDLGCDRAVAVLTRPQNAHRTDYRRLSRVLKRLYGEKYPALYSCLMNRAETAAREVKKLEELQREGRVLILRPKAAPPYKFTEDEKRICAFYAHGREVCESSIEKISEFLK